jgi:hypothetical protein
MAEALKKNGHRGRHDGGASDGRGTGDGDGGLGGSSRGMGHGTVVAITHKKTQLMCDACLCSRPSPWMDGGRNAGQGGNNTKRR